MLRESVVGAGTWERNGRRAVLIDDADPVQVADMNRVGPLACVAPPSSLSVAQSRRSAVGTVASQWGTTRPAAENGHAMKARVIAGAANVFIVNDVTTPRWPPPPPRRAQKRSGSRLGLAVTTRPSASTTFMAVTASLVSPWARVSTPTPPPWVSPAMPTVGQEPPAIPRPRVPSPSYTWTREAPAPMVAVVPLRETRWSGRTSTTSAPSPADHPG